MPGNDFWPNKAARGQSGQGARAGALPSIERLVKRVGRISAALFKAADRIADDPVPGADVLMNAANDCRLMGSRVRVLCNVHAVRV